MKQFTLLVSTDLAVEFRKVCSGNGKRMFDGNASDIVEHCGEFIALCCFQDCQLVVQLTYILTHTV